MSERVEQILLVDHDQQWAERFINTLQVRGWSISWTGDERQVYQEQLYSVYLFNLSHPKLEPIHACHYIRSLPKGENASIFLLNDGSSELRSFEDALAIKADGLYFHHAQISLLLTNFPPWYQVLRDSGGFGDTQNNTLSNRYTPNGSDTQPRHDTDSQKQNPEHPTLHNRERVLGMSLGHRNRQRLSLGYSSEGLSVSDIEAALVNIQAKEDRDTVRRAREESHQNLTSTKQVTLSGQVINSEPTFTSTSHSPPRNILATPPSINRLTHTPVHAMGASNEPTPTPSLPWGHHNEVEDVPFARCLAHLITHRLSVIIQVEESEHQSRLARWWSLTFFEGELVGVEARHLNELLAKHLIAQGVINQREADYLLSVSRQLQTSVGGVDTLIEQLVELNPQTLNSLEVAVEASVTRAVLQLFELTQGQISSIAYTRPNEPIHLKRSSTRLLIDGIKNSYGRLKLYTRFTTLKSMPLVDRASLFIDNLSERERALIEGARGHRSVSELAEDTQMTPLDALGLCYAFFLLGELEIVEVNPVKQFYQRACSEDYFQLLSLSYEDEEEEIIRAWQTHRQWIGTQRGDPEMIQSLIDILNDAYCVLAHPPLRVRYLQSLSKPIYSDMSIIPQPGEIVSFAR
jgi:hypothetical protein